jgi:hypothetical protein
MEVMSTTFHLYVGDGMTLVEERIVEMIDEHRGTTLRYATHLTDGINQIDISWMSMEMVDQILQLK